MSVTIKDVAQRSGISVATVSKYLNGVPVRPKTADKISKAIRELNYRPNLLARGLRNSSSLTLGILVENITNNFYTNIISILTDNLRERGYSCLIHEVRNMEAEKVSSALDFLASKSVDGLFILSNRIPGELIEKMNCLFSNIVVIDNYTPGLTADFVFTDNLSAAYHATEQFLIRNHKRIAIITGFSDCFTAHERLNGYLRAVQDYGISVDDELIFQENYDMNGGYNAFKQLWNMPAQKRPSAVLVTSYFMTVGTIIALNEYGLSIPQDIALICFDNYDINKVFKPSLSCVSQPTDAICRQAADYMLERISQHVCDSRIARLSPQFVQGESVNHHTA